MATEITKSWVLGNGKKVTVTGKLITEKTITCDGYTSTVPTVEITMDVNVEGLGSQGGWVRELTANEKKQVPAKYTYVVGKLVMTADQAEIVKSVKDELTSNPIWVAYQERNEKNLDEVVDQEIAMDKLAKQNNWN